jgi:hypothetical protein
MTGFDPARLADDLLSTATKEGRTPPSAPADRPENVSRGQKESARNTRRRKALTTVARPEQLAVGPDDAAVMLGMSVDAFAEHVRPHLPVIYAGRKRLYPVAGIKKWVEQNTIKPGS